MLEWNKKTLKKQFKYINIKILLAYSTVLYRTLEYSV